MLANKLYDPDSVATTNRTMMLVHVSLAMAVVFDNISSYRDKYAEAFNDETSAAWAVREAFAPVIRAIAHTRDSAYFEAAAGPATQYVADATQLPAVWAAIEELGSSRAAMVRDALDQTLFYVGVMFDRVKIGAEVLLVVKSRGVQRMCYYGIVQSAEPGGADTLIGADRDEPEGTSDIVHHTAVRLLPLEEPEASE